MRAHYRKTFDPNASFTVRRRPISAGGVTFLVGDEFDKSTVTLRRLRQLYDQRSLVITGDNPGERLEGEDAVLEADRRRTRPRLAANRPDGVDMRVHTLPPASAPHFGPSVDPVSPPPPAAPPPPPPPAETPELAARRAVAIPENWATIAWPQRLALATKLTAERVTNGVQAAAAINAELTRRGTS